MADNCFLHDSNARNHPLLMRLKKMGIDLYGIYWRLIEILHENGGSIKVDVDSIANFLRANKDRVELVIFFPGLFQIENGQLTSPRPIGYLKRIDENTWQGENQEVYHVRRD